MALLQRPGKAGKDPSITDTGAPTFSGFLRHNGAGSGMEGGRTHGRMQLRRDLNERMSEGVLHIPLAGRGFVISEMARVMERSVAVIRLRRSLRGADTTSRGKAA